MPHTTWGFFPPSFLQTQPHHVAPHLSRAWIHIPASRAFATKEDNNLQQIIFTMIMLGFSRKPVASTPSPGTEPTPTRQGQSSLFSRITEIGQSARIPKMAGAQPVETYISICYNMENTNWDQTTHRSTLAKPLGKASHITRAITPTQEHSFPFFQNNGNRPTGRNPTMASAHTLSQGNTRPTQGQSFLFFPE